MRRLGPSRSNTAPSSPRKIERRTGASIKPLPAHADTHRASASVRRIRVPQGCFKLSLRSSRRSMSASYASAPSRTARTFCPSTTKQGSSRRCTASMSARSRAGMSLIAMTCRSSIMASNLRAFWQLTLISVARATRSSKSRPGTQRDPTPAAANAGSALDAAASISVSVVLSAARQSGRCRALRRTVFGVKRISRPNCRSSSP